MYKFIKTPPEKPQEEPQDFVESAVVITLNSDDVNLEDMVQAFYDFLMACEYSSESVLYYLNI